MSQHQQRLLEIVNSVCCHPTAEEIHAMARVASPRISLGTVYRNLNTLVDTHKIRRLSIPGKPDRFDKTIPHDHLICTHCSTVIDIESISCHCHRLPAGVEVQSYEVMAYGLCADCQNREAKGNKIL